MEDLDFSVLTPAQKEKAGKLKTKEDILKFLEEEDITLSEKQLEALAGGDKSYGSFIDHMIDD